jgi:hypothetical protein
VRGERADEKDAVQDAPLVDTGMPRGLFGGNDLMAAPSKSASSQRMIRDSPFGRLNRIQSDAFNRQKRTTDISGITP